MYFRLGVTPGLGFGRLSLADEFQFYCAELIGGVAQDLGEIPVPWRFEIFQNPGIELRMNDYYPEFKLMSKRMVFALQRAGVDNLQIFPAEIAVGPARDLRHDYVVVNVVGLVSGVDRVASHGTEIADLQYLFKLKLKTGLAPGLKIFRLAESWLDVIVDGSVASALKEAALVNVSLEEV